MKVSAFSPQGGVYISYLKRNRKHNMSVQHYHDGYEIYLQIDGKRYLFYDNNCCTLSRGDVVVLRPFDLHYSQSREFEYYERYVLNFREEILSSVLSKSEFNFLIEKLQSGVIHLDEEQMQNLCGYFNRIEEYSKSKGFCCEKLLNTSVFQLVLKILEYKNESASVPGTQPESEIITALKYINKNYTENISLDDIATATHISKFHFCRKFRKATGATVLEYLNNVRLTRVHNLLLNTDTSISEIAVQTGFSSALNLSRAFKKVYGRSPREFRKLNKN